MTTDLTMTVSQDDWDNRNDMIAGMHEENKELHKIIKHILGINDDHTYVPEVYMKRWNEFNDN